MSADEDVLHFFFIQELFALYFEMSPMRIVDGDITIDKMLTLILRIWKYPSVNCFPRYWPFVWGIHRLPVNSPHKGHWRRALMFSLICFWINGWVNNGDVGDLRRNSAHYDVKVMVDYCCCLIAYIKRLVCLTLYCIRHCANALSQCEKLHVSLKSPTQHECRY